MKSARVRAFAIIHGPGERPRQPESVESSKTYPGAIWLGPWIIAVNSPAHGTRRTGLMKVVVSVELPGFARGSCRRRNTGVIGLAHKMTSICHAMTEHARA